MEKVKQVSVKCPTCERVVIWSSKAQYRPFCSKKCQLIDLGAWANEEHAISTTDTPAPHNDTDELY